MSSIYFISFFCGYPTNVKMIKEAYTLKYINDSELQHLLSIASFASISFIFVSLNSVAASRFRIVTRSSSIRFLL